MFLNGALIDNDSYVDVDDIGVGDTALLCHTDKDDCCHLEGSRSGEWYFPSGAQVLVEGIANANRSYFFRNRDQSVVRLNRINNPPERGQFRCEIPNTGGEMQTIHVNIGMCREYHMHFL